MKCKARAPLSLSNKNQKWKRKIFFFLNKREKWRFPHQSAFFIYIYMSSHVVSKRTRASIVFLLRVFFLFVILLPVHRQKLTKGDFRRLRHCFAVSRKYRSWTKAKVGRGSSIRWVWRQSTSPEKDLGTNTCPQHQSGVFLDEKQTTRAPPIHASSRDENQKLEARDVGAAGGKCTKYIYQV